MSASILRSIRKSTVLKRAPTNLLISMADMGVKVSRYLSIRTLSAFCENVQYLILIIVRKGLNLSRHA